MIDRSKPPRNEPVQPKSTETKLKEAGLLNALYSEAWTLALQDLGSRSVTDYDINQWIIYFQLILNRKQIIIDINYELREGDESQAVRDIQSMIRKGIQKEKEKIIKKRQELGCRTIRELARKHQDELKKLKQEFISSTSSA